MQNKISKESGRRGVVLVSRFLSVLTSNSLLETIGPTWVIFGFQVPTNCQHCDISVSIWNCYKSPVSPDQNCRSYVQNWRQLWFSWPITKVFSVRKVQKERSVGIGTQQVPLLLSTDRGRAASQCIGQVCIQMASTISRESKATLINPIRDWLVSPSFILYPLCS